MGNQAAHKGHVVWLKGDIAQSPVVFRLAWILPGIDCLAARESPGGGAVSVVFRMFAPRSAACICQLQARVSRGEVEDERRNQRIPGPRVGE